jgi:hypothetical protein
LWTLTWKARGELAGNAKETKIGDTPPLP